MARISMVQLVMALVLAAAALLQGTAASDYTVGGTTGWTSTLPNTTFYSAWASNITFEVGDELVFTFVTGQHDVAVVTKDAYDACTTANPISSFPNGPVTVELNTTGAHYYICTFGRHCSAGQKLSINVVADADTPPPPPGTPNTSAGSPPTTTSPPPPPPPSSASSRGVAFAFVFMSLAVAFFC